MADPRYVRHSTYFALIAEFGTSEIPLDELAGKYFGLRVTEARKQAATHRLPVVAYRLKGQKSPWLVSASSLADAIDETRERAEEVRRRDLDRLRDSGIVGDLEFHENGHLSFGSRSRR